MQYTIILKGQIKLYDRGIVVRFSVEAKNSSVLQNVHTGSRTHPVQFRDEVKRSGSEGDHSLPSKASKSGFGER